MDTANATEPSRPGADTAGEVTHLRQVTRQQWRSGIAAWLGWTFDGLDMHLYTLVAAPFVAQLIGAPRHHGPGGGPLRLDHPGGVPLGWALGGGFFGRIGDRLGRARALSLTVLTYAAFTGLSFFAQTWWHLLIFRFLAALGIGGEWAVGASLLSETWPRRWRPWIAAVLQTGVNVGILVAGAGELSSWRPRRRGVCSWSGCCRRCWCSGFAARCRSRKNGVPPRNRRTTMSQAVRDLFRGEVRRDHALGGAGLRGVADGPLGLHVLAPATPAQPARRC